MKRPWAVRPNPETGIVDREAMRDAFMDAEAILAVAGGVLSVVVVREPTDVPGERATTFAMFEWKDRTDATAHSDGPPSRAAEPDLTPEEMEAQLEAEAAAEDAEARFLAEAEQGEDETSMEPAAR